jgi:hypothetical protein
MSAQLIDLHKIWDRAPHNALTDLIRYKNSWLCAFREGMNHVSPGGRIRLLVSSDGVEWNSAAQLAIPDVDLRDPKITITPEGSLMLNAAAAYDSAASQRHLSFVWFSSNGREWSAPQKIGDPNFWLWRVTWHKDVAYSVGYSTVEPWDTRFYSSLDSVRFNLVKDRLFVELLPNEATVVFQEDDSAVCLLRRDGGTATAQIGRARPPYDEWRWKDAGIRIGGPHMLCLPDGRIIAAVRRYGKSAWTSLNWLDPVAGTLSEFLALLSGGDTGYAGLVWHESILWISYYSSHEGRTSIYLAKVKLT